MSTNANSYRIAIIGPASVVSGFKALGVEVFAATTPAEVLAQLTHLKQITLNPEEDTKYAVACIIDDVLRGVDEAEYTKVASGELPAVVVLPGPTGASDVALARLRRMSEKAIGQAII